MLCSLPPIHQALLPYISTYHVIELNQPMTDYQMVPASSKCMLNIPYDNGVKIRMKDLHQDMDKAFFMGLTSQSYEFKAMQKGACGTFIIEFSDIGFTALFKENACLFTDTLIPMESVVASCKLMNLQGQLAEAPSISAKVKVVEHFLLQFLPDKRSSYRLQRYAAVLNSIRASKGMLNVSECAKDCCISERQFHRIISEIKGCSPKDFARLVRFSHVFADLMLHTGPVEWSDLVYRYRFYDQMHFIKEFKKFAIYTPTSFRKEQYIFSNSFFLPSLMQQYRTV